MIKGMELTLSFAIADQGILGSISIDIGNGSFRELCLKLDQSGFELIIELHRHVILRLDAAMLIKEARGRVQYVKLVHWKATKWTCVVYPE